MDIRKDRGGVVMSEWLTVDERNEAEKSDEAFWRLYKIAVSRKSNHDVKKAMKIPFIVAAVVAIIALIFLFATHVY